MPKEGEHKPGEEPGHELKEHPGKKRVIRREHLDPEHGKETDPEAEKKKAAEQSNKEAGNINEPDPNDPIVGENPDRQPDRDINDPDMPAAGDHGGGHVVRRGEHSGQGLSRDPNYQIISGLIRSDADLQSTAYGNLEPVRALLSAGHEYEQVHAVLDGALALGMDPKIAASNYDSVAAVLNNPEKTDEEKKQALIDAGYMLPGAPAKTPDGDEEEGRKEDKGKAAESCCNVIRRNKKKSAFGAVVSLFLLSGIITLAILRPWEDETPEDKDKDEDKDKETLPVKPDPAWQVLLEKTGDGKDALVKELRDCLSQLRSRDEATYWQDLIDEVSDGTLECLAASPLGVKKLTRMPYTVQLLMANFMYFLQKAEDRKADAFDEVGELKTDVIKRVRASVQPPFPVKQPTDGNIPDPVPLWQAIANLKTLQGDAMSRRNKLIVLRDMLYAYLGEINNDGT